MPLQQEITYQGVSYQEIATPTSTESMGVLIPALPSMPVMPHYWQNQLRHLDAHMTDAFDCTCTSGERIIVWDRGQGWWRGVGRRSWLNLLFGGVTGGKKLERAKRASMRHDAASS
jgi:hypothetical protein